MLSSALLLVAVGTVAAQTAGNTAPSLDAGIRLSSAEGMEANARLVAAVADMRLWLGDSPPEASAGLALPYVRLGATRPVGLTAFLYRPAAAGPLLLGVSGAPLALDSPESASGLGASLGEDFGLLAMAPRADAGRLAYGAWLSPRGGHGQAMLVAAREPAEEGGPSWSDTPVAASTRFWSAVTASAGGKAWAIAGAGAAGMGFPGPDVAACRMEARASAGQFRAEFEASAANASWLGPDGKEAPELRLDADFRWSRRGLAATVGYRLTVDDLTERVASNTTLRASAAYAGSLGQARVGAMVSHGREVEAPTIETDARIRPGLLPWLTLSGSWRAADGAAQRLDLFASVDSGDAVRFCLDSGLRFVSEGHLLKASCAMAARLHRVVAEAGVRTGGWVEAGEISLSSLEYFLGVRASLR